MATAKVEKKADLEKGIVTFAIADGKDPIVFELSKVSNEMRTKLATHGAAQKIGDGYAGMKAEKDPLAFAREVVETIIERLYDDNWSTGGGGARVSILLEAFAALAGKTVDDEEIVEAWNALSDDEKKATAAKTKFQIELNRIKRARADAEEKRLMEKLAKEEAEAAAA